LERGARYTESCGSTTLLSRLLSSRCLVHYRILVLPVGCKRRIPSSQNRLPARKVRWTKNATEKLICHMLINALPNAYEQDVCRFHADSWLRCFMFHKALRSEQPYDQFAIATRSNSQPFDVPVPR